MPMGTYGTVKGVMPRCFHEMGAQIILGKNITLIGDADFQLVQNDDIRRAKLTKRSPDVRFLDVSDVQKSAAPRSSW